MLDWQIQATEAHKSKDPTALTTYYLLKSRPEVGWGMITPRIPQRAHGVTRGRTLPLSAWGRTSSRSSTQAPRGTGAKRKSESNLASFVAKPSKANQKKTP